MIPYYLHNYDCVDAKISYSYFTQADSSRIVRSFVGCSNIATESVASIIFIFGYFNSEIISARNVAIPVEGIEYMLLETGNRSSSRLRCDVAIISSRLSCKVNSFDMERR